MKLHVHELYSMAGLKSIFGIEGDRASCPLLTKCLYSGEERMKLLTTAVLIYRQKVDNLHISVAGKPIVAVT